MIEFSSVLVCAMRGRESGACRCKALRLFSRSGFRVQGSGSRVQGSGFRVSRVKFVGCETHVSSTEARGKQGRTCTRAGSERKGAMAEGRRRGGERTGLEYVPHEWEPDGLRRSTQVQAVPEDRTGERTSANRKHDRMRGLAHAKHTRAHTDACLASYGSGISCIATATPSFSRLFWSHLYQLHCTIGVHPGCGLWRSKERRVS